MNRFRTVSDSESELPLVSDFYIRASHPAAFRPWQWAKVVEVAWIAPKAEQPGRPVYVVEFVDGRRDLWPVYDTEAGYEFAWEPR